MDESAVLMRLLRRYSPSGSEEAAVREFVRIAEAMGYYGSVDAAGNGVARRGRGRPRVVYLGHIDTVPGRCPTIRTAGRIRGRGAVDAKGPLATALTAGTRHPGPGSLEIIAAVGEETDSRGARYLARRGGIDAVIAGEPSRWDGVTIGYKGDVRLTAHFRGRRSHFSSPRPTTADVALQWLQRVRESTALVEGTSPFRSPSLKVVAFRSGGDDLEWAALTLDLRVPPGRTAAAFLYELPREPGRPRVETHVRIDPIETDRSNPVVRALEEGIRRQGGRPTLWRKSGTSDLNLVAPAWKAPGAAYGPGDPHLDHTARESVSERELGRAVRVLEFAFQRLAEELAASRPSSGVRGRTDPPPARGSSRSTPGVGRPTACTM